jgi:hypothetical protein
VAPVQDEGPDRPGHGPIVRVFVRVLVQFQIIVCKLWILNDWLPSLNAFLTISMLKAPEIRRYEHKQGQSGVSSARRGVSNWTLLIEEHSLASPEWGRRSCDRSAQSLDKRDVTGVSVDINVKPVEERFYLRAA